MGYYREAGDYYRQAGGLFGSLFGAVKKVGGAVVKGIGTTLSTGNPLSGVVAAGSSLIGSGASPTMYQGPMVSMGGSLPPMPGTSLAAGGKASGTALAKPPATGVCIGGWHLNKSTYYTRTNGQLVHAGTHCVKNRKLNPGNAKALRRAVRRQEAFVGLARRAMKGTNYKVVNKSYRQNWRKPTRR